MSANSLNISDSKCSIYSPGTSLGSVATAQPAPLAFGPFSNALWRWWRNRKFQASAPNLVYERREFTTQRWVYLLVLMMLLQQAEPAMLFSEKEEMEVRLICMLHHESRLLAVTAVWKHDNSLKGIIWYGELIPVGNNISLIVCFFLL